MAAMSTYQCRHCDRNVGVDCGADDAIERAVGPICDDCASRLLASGFVVKEEPRNG